MTVSFFGGRGDQGSRFNTGMPLNTDITMQGGVQQGLQRQQIEAQKKRDADQFGYQTGLAGQAQAADAARQAAQLGFNREQLNAQTGLSQQQMNLATTQNAQKEGWRGRVYGDLQGVLKGINDWRSGYSGKGPVAGATPVDATPVYNDQQVNERVNATRAGTDASVASKNQEVANSMAARGYGTKSPLAMAMQNANFMGGLQGNAAAENDLRWNAAQGNKAHVLNAQKLLEQQRAALNQEDIERGKVSLGALTSALGTMGGMFV